MTSSLKAIFSFEEWKQKNHGLENWVECPRCFGWGATPEDEAEGVLCLICEGESCVNDLRSLYEQDLEHDLRLVFAVYPPNKMTPGLKKFLSLFHVDGVYP